MALMEITFTGNQSTITEFILLGFSELPDLHLLFFIFSTIIYITIILGNMLIIVAVVSSSGLHTPMYFFLVNLSFLEILYTSTVVPKMLAGFLRKKEAISLAGCLLQFFIFGSLATSECFLLAIMAYDRYLAICYPLHYTLLMGSKQCVCLVVTAWLTGFVVDGLVVVLMAQLKFCGSNHINHFYCDFMPIVGLACSDPQVAQATTFILSVICLTIPFGLILISYARILMTVLKVPTGASRKKAFSTCSSHLAVVSTFYGTLMVMYIAPSAIHSQLLSKVFALLYTVVTPIFNPVIYTLRNKEVHQALKKLLCNKQQGNSA